MKIPLSRGLFATVDDDAGTEITDHKWHASKDGYAWRHSGLRKVIMHRVVAGAPNGTEVDHINHDKLDNRRENLRLCTRTENQRNQPKRKKETLSRFKGVSYHRRASKWQASIGAVYLGLFDTQESAADAYNRAAIETFGEFASLNNITGGMQP